MKERDFIKTINEIDGKAYIVGGWVRDKVMGREPHDKDYAVCGITETSFFEKFPKAKKVGSSFPVFLLLIDGVQSEVAFARTERKTGSGYTGFSVTFGREITIEDDLYRRDTTMNSMAWDLQNSQIIDPYEGSCDIKNKTIRATSKHFLDDPVRALRAARQSAQFGFVIEPYTLEMMNKCAKELSLEPKERIVEETTKALASDNPSIYFRVLEETGLLSVIFPWLANLVGKTQSSEYHSEGNAFEHTMFVLDNVAKRTPRIEVRFAALVHDIGKSVTHEDTLPHHYEHKKIGLKVLKEINDVMTLPSLWYKCAEFAIKEHMRPFKINDPSKVVDLLVRLNKHPIRYDGFAAIISADNQGELPDCLVNYEEYMKAIHSSHDLKIPENLDGPKIGEWVRQKEIEAFKKAIIKP